MTDKQPEALEVAAFCDGNVLYHTAAALLRTQHEAIERKDALLRQALDLVHEAQTYTESPAWSPSMTGDLQMLRLSITKELSK